MRCERCEGIIGNFRPGGRDTRNERGFPHIGKTDQADISQQFELHLQLPFLAIHALLREAGGLMCGRFEVSVAFSADAAFGCYEDLSGFGQVGQNFSGFKVFDDGSRRNNYDQVFRAAPGSVVAGAMPAVFGKLMLLVFQIQQGMVASVCTDNDITALAAVSAVGSAFGNKLFPPETYAACSAVSTPHIYLCFVNKLHQEKAFFLQYI